MKVAYILNTFPVLYNSFTVNEMIAVENRSIDVIGFALKQSKHKTVNENSSKIEKSVHYFSDFLPGSTPSVSRIVSKFGNAISRRISKSLYNTIGKIIYGNSLSEINVNKYIHLHGWNVFTYENVAKYMLENQVDVIHAGFGNRPATAAMILSELTGIPFTFETHAYDLFVDFPFQQEKLKQASKIFTISNYNKKYLTNECECDDSKVSVMRVPINQKFCDSIVAGPRKSLQLISVCRLHPIKGLAVALEAVAILVKHIPDVRLILIGDGSIKSELKALCKKLDIEQNIQFYGSAGNEEVLKIVSESAIFLLPCVIAENGDRDGIPTSLIEAMYLKTPVVSTKVSGIPELIEDGIEGFLVEPKNVYELSDRIKRLLESEELRNKMGVQGNIKVCKKFYIEDCEDVLIRGWSEILN